MSFRIPFVAFAGALALALPVHAATDWAAVGRALGKAGALQPGGVYRVGMPRSDLKVTLDGVSIKPALALGSWLAFRDMGDQAEVMGDLVLLQGEVNPVISALEAGGVQVTALHNHLLRSSPATMYMHVDGRGDAVRLAATLHAALARTRTPLGAGPPAKPEPIGLDTASLDRVIGAAGKPAGGVWQYSIARAEPVRAAGMTVPGAMGSAIGINFQSLGGGKAAATGDFVLTADEVNPVIRALRANKIEVTAIHNHMLDEEPRLFFLHFWGKGDAEALAQGLKAALHEVKVAGR